MSFFEGRDVPEPEPIPQRKRPVSSGPPRGVLPGVLPGRAVLDSVLARSGA